MTWSEVGGLVLTVCASQYISMDKYLLGLFSAHVVFANKKLYHYLAASSHRFSELLLAAS